ncbi:MAG: GGDEF domain-containing protein [Actinobacteria bacterium]|nr:MAG: GGDEF domain-containing protein [Actinomycetota bacterium]
MRERSVRRRNYLEGWVVLVIVLAAVGVAAVGAMGARTTANLGNAADRTAVQRQALRRYESAMYSRSAIDASILKAAGGGADQKGVAAEADRLSQQVETDLRDARDLFEAGYGPGPLLTTFDAMAAAMKSYVESAGALTGLMTADPPAVPAHLLEMSARAVDLEQRQLEFSAQITSATAEARASATALVDSSYTRILWATSAAIIALLLLAAAIYRRMHLTFAAKTAAEETTRVSSARLLDQIERQEFAEDLHEALDGAPDEGMTLSVIERALRQLPLSGVAEVLLADSSSAHVHRAASTSDAPGCGVASPNDCPAVRRGQALTFPSSEALRACPLMQGRASGPLSATCVPLLFNGQGIGVLHATGPEGEEPTSLAAAGIRAIANDGAMRIGTMRVIATTQFQAKTDGLTGMVNRRTLEERLREHVNANASMTLAMVDLDHFKRLNDTYGHEAGDRALRVFSTVVHDSLRTGDIAGRYGGEEFVLAFPGLALPEALGVIERVRDAVRDATDSGACPAFTAGFGVAEWQPGMTVDAILRIADDRLREAKRLGRDRVISDEPLLLTT